jgi:Zn-dependent protease with chaperone function
MMSMRRRRSSLSGLSLMALTLALDLPAVVFRAFFGSGIAMSFGLSESDSLVVGGVFGYFPFLRSLLALTCGPATRLFLRHSYGARDPSEREADRLYDALSACVQDEVKPPRYIYVIDSAEVPVAFVEGGSLFVQRDSVWSPHLVGLVAHELGHLNSVDQRLSTAARWASFPTLRAAGRALLRMRGPVILWIPMALIAFQLHLVAGGQLPRLLNPLWRWWGRRREFAADSYAARLGHGESLAAALEEQLPFDVASPWMKGRSHPYAELRIDRLRAHSGPGMSAQRDARHRQLASSSVP